MRDNDSSNNSDSNKIIPKEGAIRKKRPTTNHSTWAYYVKHVAKVLVLVKYKTRHDITAA
jgi:hypothetical protein